MHSIYDQQLGRHPANFVALSPVSFVERSAEVFSDLPAVVHGQRRYTWAQTRERCARLAAALRAMGVARGSTVSVMLPNSPEMVEAHYAVPALNAVLNTLNTRLDPALLAWQMNHCEAVVEPDRYVKIRDRSKDVIISGGENISSIEVEDALYRHPAVLACAVVAKPDPKWGETPLAFVELRHGASASAAELIAHCKGLLASYKVPRELRFEEIPKTSTGKIQKFQLRERARSVDALK